MLYKGMGICCLCMLLGACATQQETMPSYEEVRLREAIYDCKQDANAIVDPPHSSWNLHWDNYFTMCMKTRYGYSNDEIRKMRY